jgi:hypothetical protein
VREEEGMINGEENRKSKDCLEKARNRDQARMKKKK